MSDPAGSPALRLRTGDRMPPIYELSSPFFYHSQDRAEVVKNVGGKILDINTDNGEAGMYFAVRSDLDRGS